MHRGAILDIDIIFERNYAMKKIICYKFTFLLLLCCVLCCGCSDEGDSFEYFQNATTETGESTLLETVEDVVEESKIEESVIVYICGAIEHTGVYELPVGSRVYEVIEMAGGLTKDAAYDVINQARVLEDGEQIKIVTAKEAEKIKQVVGTDVSTLGDSCIDSRKIDINHASVDELTTLPGIGTQKAKAIETYRNEQGGFQTIEDITKISGIGDSIFQKIKDKIVAG